MIYIIVEESIKFQYDIVIAVVSTNVSQVLEALSSVLAYLSTFYNTRSIL